VDGSCIFNFYIKVENGYGETFSYVLNYMNANNIKLAGAVFDENFIP